ncbi:putative regulatory protein [Buttiauxella ferragutiae ATCC 51602]|uniref:Arabinose operon regulatory protein n=1 Tax=Buttiauxella ferragutiae ATCC 51602 TaxID=1354252 RepID=A0ABX2WBX8_9ENTR|nr:AraC family transcriptional regulator [Buttiauxella ferragutiae]OAT30321.1 putative regulatory protein [Buttiauxella ferragutiae ATCC 51602]
MFDLKISLPISVQNGGLFISRGIGSHPQRELDSWELIFVEKGTLTIREDDTLFSVREGESLLLWPHRKHVGTGTFPADLKFYWLHFELTPQCDKKTDFPASLISLPQHGQVLNPQYVISLFRQFLSEQESMTRSSALELILLLIMQQLSVAAHDSIQADNSGAALAYKAQQLIRTQFHLPVSTSTLASQLHCNADYLGRVYRQTFQLTITDAIHRQRVLCAEKMLITDSCSLSEVAECCGFQDVSYFRKVFRKKMGLTPAAWKRRYCKVHINSD